MYDRLRNVSSGLLNISSSPLHNSSDELYLLESCPFTHVLYLGLFLYSRSDLITPGFVIVSHT